ncbi:MAG TPA: DNA-binding domain-containing protein [Polyangiaceae bacterium]
MKRSDPNRGEPAQGNPQPKNELDELQFFFAEQLRKRRALPKDAELSERARSIVRATGRLSAVERLEIYREQFWLRHTASLVEDFPGLSGILGQAAWEDLIEGYLEVHPPRSFTLRDLGLELPEYVEARPDLAQHALCCDMARLERAYLELFDAADATPLNAAALAAIPEAAWENARIELSPTLRLLEVEYPVAELRQRVFLARDGGIELLLASPEKQRLLLFRRDLSLFHEAVAAGAFALLRSLTQRVPLVAACERAQAEIPEEAASVAANVGAWFADWTARGFIASIEV